ncbi:hypothetical protein KC343_g3059, partial [Hortaea werneckii]
WIQVYDLTNDARYLHTAEEIFEDLTTGLNATCGGQWWDTAHTASNTINNALYISVAAHLANRVPTTTTSSSSSPSSSSSSSKPPETYRAAARSHLHWLRAQNLLTPNGTYVDGLDLSTCTPAGPVFTYNQGVMIGALVEMSRFATTTTFTTSSSSSAAEDQSEEEEGGASLLLDQAETLANGTITSLVDPAGILTETAFAPSFPNLDLVAAQFKGSSSGISRSYPLSDHSGRSIKSFYAGMRGVCGRKIGFLGVRMKGFSGRRGRVLWGP